MEVVSQSTTVPSFLGGKPIVLTSVKMQSRPIGLH